MRTLMVFPSLRVLMQLQRLTYLMVSVAACITLLHRLGM